jgi:hypothetical protein
MFVVRLCHGSFMATSVRFLFVWALLAARVYRAALKSLQLQSVGEDRHLGDTGGDNGR